MKIQLVAKCELDKRQQQHVGQRIAIAANPGPSLHLAIKPHQLFLRDALQLGRRHGTNQRHAAGKQPTPFGGPKRIGHRLDDRQIDPPCPHPRLGPLLGGGADDRRPGIHLVDILGNHGDFADGAGVLVPRDAVSRAQGGEHRSGAGVAL